MNHLGRIIYVSILIFILTILTVYNIGNYAYSFWKINIYQVLSLILSSLFIFFMSQLFTDKRIQKEIVMKVLESIQRNTECSNAWIIKTKNDLNLLKINKRSLNNNLYRLEKYAKKMHIEDEVKRMREYFENYDKFFGEHEGDINYLSKSESELRKSLELINGVAFDIMIKLYD